MASHLSALVIALVMLAALGLICLNRGRDTRAILQNRFRASQAPDGALTECEVRFPLGELPTPCVAHASEVGLYLVSSTEQVAKWRWNNNVPFLKQPTFIPWTELHYYRARAPLQSWLRFDIRNTKATFFVCETVALELLRAAGWPMQP
jgi:hypothetical protein